ncbi:MAG TPA: hypothetical protein PL037_01685, partial [Elusimicrobiales bacterium]|nr:hypothetical protein [Elusimicrobiales bacterium]
DGSAISRLSYDASKWHPIARMPATVLQALQDAGVYRDLYFGKNMTEKVPGDLFRRDWWYRVAFEAPAGGGRRSLLFKGINYRGEIWLNGERIAGDKTIAGMYNEFELDVTGRLKPGPGNVLAVKVTPEQALQDVDGVELADSWFDWINWKYLGYRSPDGRVVMSYVPDRNAGVWKKVYLRSTGDVEIKHPYAAAELPLPSTASASITVYCDLSNRGRAPVSGVLEGKISRDGKQPVYFSREVSLAPGESREEVFSPEEFPQLKLESPDLWWPYQWGRPDLYDLRLDFRTGEGASDSAAIRFGIREITAHRDRDARFPELGGGGNFYLRVNGRDFLARGAVYTPDLLFKYDEKREDAIIRYVKDLGLNLLRWELKMSSERMLDLADEAGIPVMAGWMCCNQWEKWGQWDEEDRRVALESQRARIRELRPHASAVLWANASDGLPPPDVREGYRGVLRELHWGNPVVDTVSSFGKDAEGKTVWDGIRMEGPYSWRSPAYWFGGHAKGSTGSSAEQGDNESVPVYASLKKFIPADRLWPINDWWYYHAGAGEGNNTLSSIVRAVEKRYGPSSGAAEFSEKAQLAHYENTRAQFESFAAVGRGERRMTLYWMLNSHWPSFFGHLIDYYLAPGGAYFGAKKGLRPVSVVYDGYAAGDRTSAGVYVVNGTLRPLAGLKASVSFIGLDGTIKYEEDKTLREAAPLSSSKVMELARRRDLGPAFFVRCRLTDASGAEIADNVYWQSASDDDPGPPSSDNAFSLSQDAWADMTPFNRLPQADVAAEGGISAADGWVTASVRLTNRSAAPAFFMRAEIIGGPDGEEILPVTWNDNYVTVFGGETKVLEARFRSGDSGGRAPFLRLKGRNIASRTVRLK